MNGDLAAPEPPLTPEDAAAVHDGAATDLRFWQDSTVTLPSGRTMAGGELNLLIAREKASR